MNKRLFVAGLPFTASQDELKALFAAYGNVVSATIITDRDSGRSKGFGFVEMETDEEAQNAMTKLDGSDFGGRKLIVNVAKPKEENRRPQGGYNRGYSGGGGGGRGGFGGPKRSFSGRREGGRGSFGRDRSNSGRGGFRGGDR